ncbi:MAG: IS630 family transposase [Alphaproteobacteria bacterium]|nr:IS630 family transposase [Alphaproteobacteria bacterium]
MTFLRELRRLIKIYGSENVVYFDESGFVSHKERLSGWAPGGQKLYIDVKGKREKRTNLLMAQRGKELLAPFVFTGSCTAKTVDAWMKRFLIRELKKPSIVIMDNAPVHNKKTMRSLLKKHGHAMLPLPTYSPDFNPIEQSFGAMKKRREGMPIETTVEELVMSYL